MFTYINIDIGLIKCTPLNCNSMSDGICVKHVRRGQPVTLCTSHTTIPPTIPQGKHVISVSVYYWKSYIESHRRSLYRCSRGSCERSSSDVRDFLYSKVSNSCLTINSVLNKSKYILDIPYNEFSGSTNATFSVTYGGMCEHV